MGECVLLKLSAEWEELGSILWKSWFASMAPEEGKSIDYCISFSRKEVETYEHT